VCTGVVENNSNFKPYEVHLGWAVVRQQREREREANWNEDRQRVRIFALRESRQSPQRHFSTNTLVLLMEREKKRIPYTLCSANLYKLNTYIQICRCQSRERKRKRIIGELVKDQHEKSWFLAKRARKLAVRYERGLQVRVPTNLSA